MNNSSPLEKLPWTGARPSLAPLWAEIGGVFPNPARAAKTINMNTFRFKVPFPGMTVFSKKQTGRKTSFDREPRLAYPYLIG
jgi:hypothetical protein